MEERGRFPCYIKGEVVASVPASLHLSPVYSNHTAAVSSPAFILLYFSISLFCFSSDSDWVSSAPGEQSYEPRCPFIVNCIMCSVCVCVWANVKGVRRERNPDLLEKKVCACVYACTHLWQSVAHWKLICQCGCVLFTDCVLHCGILVGSFQDAAIMLTSSLSCHTLLEVLYMSSPWALLQLCTMPCTKHHNKVVKSISSITVTQCSCCVLIHFWCICKVFVSQCCELSEIRVMCQCCPGAECSCLFLQTKPPCVPVQSGQCKGGWLHIFPQIQAPLLGLGNTSRPLHLLLSGKPMVCGFCLGFVHYIQTT